jgi:hypothetical protein
METMTYEPKRARVTSTCLNKLINARRARKREHERNIADYFSGY